MTYYDFINKKGSSDLIYINMQRESLLEKKQALQALDNAKFGWFHIKACLVSGIGFFTDAYDLFII